MPDSYWIGLTIGKIEAFLFHNVTKDVISGDVKRVLLAERERLMDNFETKVKEGN